MAATSLTITTNLGDQQSTGDRGPFLLAAVQGVEGISMPYAFDLTLYRRMDAEEVDPSILINTPGKFGILQKDKYLTRSGVFKSFEKAGTTEQSNTAQTDFNIYRARLVPAISMLDYEQVFRVFEKMTVMDIVKEAIGDFPNINVANYLLPRLSGETFPLIDYCVQFNETTFAFLSRLLGEFGIWYYFEHPGPDDKRAVEQMVLGRKAVGLKECAEPKVEFDKKNFFRAYQIAHRTTRVGDYNILKPDKPAFGEVDVLGTYDASPADDSFGTRMRRQVFPGIMPRADPGGDASAAKADAGINQDGEEARVFTVQGQGKNKTFRAGQRFTVKVDDDKKKTPAPGFGPAADGEFLLTRLSISAVEHALGHGFLQDVLNFINPLHWFSRNAGAKQSVVDITSSIAGSSLYGSLKDEAEKLKLSSKLQQITSGLASGMGVFGSVFSFFADSITEVINAHDDDYSNSYVAVPLQNGRFNKLPLPIYEPVRAYGPQIAVVIGPKGVADNSSDLLVDALGRVRVRFPWHTDLPDGGETDPWKTDRRTAWVRAAEGWAGLGMGTQFLPRIGDEVIVSYVDGDPARPVITGRMYNAGNGSPGYPFPPNRTDAKPVETKVVHQPTPASASLRSGIRTRSTPRPDGQKDRFHLLRFDDAWHDEQLLLRSQGRTDVTSLGVWHDTSHGNRHVLIGGKDPDTGKGGGALFITTGDEYDLHVGGDRFEAADKTYQLSVKADTLFDLKGNHDTIVKSASTLNAGTIVLEAAMKITLKVGSSFVVIDPAGVFIKGAIKQINTGGSPDSTSDKDVTDVADAGTADPGDPPDWLARHPPGKGGPRGHHSAVAQHGLTVTRSGNDLKIGNITVKGNAEYQDTVVSQIAQMNQTPTGKAMLDDYQLTGKNMTIQDRPGTDVNATTTPANLANAKNGTGTDSTIAYNPKQWPDPSAPDVPGDVILMHEMTHAEHNAHGTNARDTPHGGGFDNDEEFNTIQQENKYRDDRGIRNRANHRGL